MKALKSLLLVAILAGLMIQVGTCHEERAFPKARLTTSKQTIPDSTLADENLPFAKASEATRVALIEPCGRCHQSTLETHKKGAIAIFDLDMNEQWHSKLKLNHLEGIRSRTKSNSAISDEEQVQITQFIAAKSDQLK